MGQAYFYTQIFGMTEGFSGLFSLFSLLQSSHPRQNLAFWVSPRLLIVMVSQSDILLTVAVGGWEVAGSSKKKVRDREDVAIAHALWIKNNGLKLRDIALLSIGTGNTTRPYSYEEIKWGVYKGWVQHIPDIFLNPAAKNSEDICNQILDSVGGDLRLDFDLNDRLVKSHILPGRLYLACSLLVTR